MDVAVRFSGIQVQKLRLNNISSVIVDLCAEEDDAIHHQTGENIHLRHVELALLEDRRTDVVCLRLSGHGSHGIVHYSLDMHAVHALCGCEFQEIVHCI